MSIEPKAGDLIFFYGSVQSCFENGMAALLRSDAETLGPALYQGRLFLVAWYPDVLASDNPTDVVHGELYKIHTDPSALTQKLDEYECVGANFPHPQEYERLRTQVIFLEEKVEARLYEYRWPIQDTIPSPEGRFTPEIFQNTKEAKEKAAQ